MGGGVGVGLGGQNGCERRIEVFVKIQKKKNFGGGGEDGPLRVQSHIEIRLPSRTTLFKAPPPSVSGD